MSETALRVLQILANEDMADTDDLWWRTDGEYAPVTFFIKCSDMFWWGTADVERITAENIGEFEKCFADCRSADNPSDRLHHEIFAPQLFCARIRKMRPQGAYYPNLPKDLWPLFDACGPERDVDTLNPRKHP